MVAYLHENRKNHRGGFGGLAQYAAEDKVGGWKRDEGVHRRKNEEEFHSMHHWRSGGNRQCGTGFQQ